ncbi:MAG: manganese-binding transcriptional regulator MntR [Phycisphaerales bacterium]
MSTRPIKRNTFAKVRADHARETAEDYVEAVADIIRDSGECRVVDLARHMGVSHVTVTRIVARLQAEGFVSTEPYRPIRLTQQGQDLARESRRRHTIVLEFLRAIGVPAADASRDAEGIEHHVSDGTLKCMAALVRRQHATDEKRTQHEMA